MEHAQPDPVSMPCCRPFGGRVVQISTGRVTREENWRRSQIGFGDSRGGAVAGLSGLGKFRFHWRGSPGRRFAEGVDPEGKVCRVTEIDGMGGSGDGGVGGKRQASRRFQCPRFRDDGILFSAEDENREVEVWEFLWNGIPEGVEEGSGGADKSGAEIVGQAGEKEGEGFAEDIEREAQELSEKTRGAWVDGGGDEDGAFCEPGIPEAKVHDDLGPEGISDETHFFWPKGFQPCGEGVGQLRNGEGPGGLGASPESWKIQGMNGTQSGE